MGRIQLHRRSYVSDREEKKEYKVYTRELRWNVVFKEAGVKSIHKVKEEAIAEKISSTDCSSDSD